MKTKVLHQLSALIGLPIGEPTPTFEDNQGTIKCLKAAHISENVQHLDIKITWLAEQYDEGVVSLEYTKTHLYLLIAKPNQLLLSYYEIIILT